MILYKYLPPDRIDVLQNRRIRFTQPGDFNDPFEFRPHIATLTNNSLIHKQVENNFEQLVDQQLAKIGGLIDSIPTDLIRPLFMAQKERLPEIINLLQPHLIDAVSPRLQAMFDQNVGLLCLSEVRDSLLMWGHYTNNHQGFVIGFDSEHPFFSKQRTAQDDFGFLRQVQYQRQRPSVTLADTSSPVWFQTKSEDWKYEKEWRIARVLSDASRRIDHKPFPICLFDFPQEAVREIIFGLRATPDLVQKVEAILPAFRKAALLRMKESPLEYGLLIEEVPRRSAAGY